MFWPAEQEKKIEAELAVMRSGEARDVSLCRYGKVSCVRCCLPHIGGDAHIADSGEEDGYLGPGGLAMKFRNFNPLKDPGIEASQYEDSFPDVGREEMERRFSERRELFLEIYDRQRPRESLAQYMEAAKQREGYKYEPAANAGPVSLFVGGVVPAVHVQKGELPECQLLGFVDAKRTPGCMAHPLAETSRGYDGRDLAGFFHHTGCCASVGCEASREFRYLSKSALKVFGKTVEGMSWYRYSRHSTSVLVYYLRSYDFVLRELDEREVLEGLSLERLAGCTNTLYEEWPFRKPGRKDDSDHMSSLEILTTGVPASEAIMYIALGSRFFHGNFAGQVQQARQHIETRIRTAPVWKP